MEYLTLLLSVVVIVASVRFGLVHGLNNVARSFNWSPKVRGQVTGLATSVPEAAALLSTALAGVWSAGLWNIASSNIINCILLLSAAFYYRKHFDLMKRHFFDEIGFALAAVFLPVILMLFGMDRSFLVVPFLLAFFFIYRVVDRRLNSAPHPSISVEVTIDIGEEKGVDKGVFGGAALIMTSLIIIIGSSKILGDSAGTLIHTMGIPSVLVGWILGVITSIPELMTFFLVYKKAGQEGTLRDFDDTQEALDNLTASNMSNVGLIYPLCLAVFLVVNSFL